MSPSFSLAMCFNVGILRQFCCWSSSLLSFLDDNVLGTLMILFCKTFRLLGTFESVPPRVWPLYNRLITGMSSPRAYTHCPSPNPRARKNVSPFVDFKVCTLQARATSLRGKQFYGRLRELTRLEDVGRSSCGPCTCLRPGFLRNVLLLQQSSIYHPRAA